jgi:hypothetical protein
MMSLGAFYATGRVRNKKRRKDSRTYLQPLSHILRNDTKADTGEIVDAEAGIFGDVGGEHAGASMLNFRVLEPFFQSRQTHTLHHLLHQNLDEDTTTTCRIIFVHFDAFKDGPGNGIRGKHVAKEPGDITEPVGFVSVDGVVVVDESLLEAIGPDAVESAETFPDEPVESRI